jgi:hypothetical protein
MNDKLNFKAELSNKKSTIKTGLSLICFEDENVHFVYCPALDITGYGYDTNEAKESFAQSLKMYFEYTTNKNTLFNDLESHGWVVKNKRKIKSPDFDFLFGHNEQLKKIVNERPFSKYDELIQFPDYAYA